MEETKLYRVVVEYQSLRRIIKINPSSNVLVAGLVKEIFSLEAPFTCIVKSLQAEIKYTNEVEQGDELVVSLLDAPQQDQQVQNSHEEAGFEANRVQLNEQDFENLKNLKISEKNMKVTINLWANPLKFHLYLSEGIKYLVKGAKRTARCKNIGCSFKLTFLAANAKKGVTDEDELE